MSNPVEKGSIFINETADLPEGLYTESEPYAKGWKLFTKLNRRGLERYINQAAWNLFFIAGGISASAIGREGEKTTQRAIMNLTRNPEMRTYNCLEIARVSVRSFMGIPYVNVGANICHIQQSARLARAKSVDDSRPTYASS